MSKFWWKLKVAIKLLFSKQLFAHINNKTYSLDKYLLFNELGGWSHITIGNQQYIVKYLDYGGLYDDPRENICIGFGPYKDCNDLIDVLCNGFEKYKITYKKEIIKFLKYNGWREIDSDHIVITKEEYENLKNNQKEDTQESVTPEPENPDIENMDWQAHIEALQSEIKTLKSKLKKSKSK